MCVAITLDADFQRAETAVGILDPVLEHYRVEIKKGALISVKEHRVSCHWLLVGKDP
jgi:hypothetical protein